MVKYVRLIDTTKCIGCKGCQVACKHWNRLPAVETVFTGSYENPTDMDPFTWSRLKFNEYEGNGEVKWYFSFFSCMHCTEAGCIEACRRKAIKRTDMGAVIIDQEDCNACGACTEACPFDVPRVGEGVPRKGSPYANRFTQPTKLPHQQHRQQVGAGAAYKCNFCLDRITKGQSTACSKACPTGAIVFGTAVEKIAEAEDRVALLKDRGVANAQLYGVNELGGLGVIYVLANDPEKYALPVNPAVSYIALSYNSNFWKAAMNPLKIMAAAGLLAGMLGTWYTNRRETIKKEKAE